MTPLRFGALVFSGWLIYQIGQSTASTYAAILAALLRV